MMRGTLTYMPPDPAPSEASDVYALGVTLLDAILLDGDAEQLPRGPGGTLDRPGARAWLKRLAGDEAELAGLVVRRCRLTSG